MANAIWSSSDIALKSTAPWENIGCMGNYLNGGWKDDKKCQQCLRVADGCTEPPCSYCKGPFHRRDQILNHGIKNRFVFSLNSLYNLSDFNSCFHDFLNSYLSLIGYIILPFNHLLFRYNMIQKVLFKSSVDFAEYNFWDIFMLWLLVFLYTKKTSLA